ncbi:hypothetical protein CISIN_1g040641mg, partial [Citrus sinensis]
LTGSIPSEFGDSLKLQGLYLGNNQLTGSIPRSLGQLGGLVKLNLTRNKFSGPVPTSLGNLKGLSHLDLSSNFFDGGWPRSLGNLSYSTYLDLHDNKFTREIPQNLGNLAQLEHLDVLRNMLCGKIPEKICKSRLEGLVSQSGICQNLSKISLAGNKDYNLYLSSSRSKGPLRINISMFQQPLLKLTLVDILEDGGFGTVYKATLPDGKTVAVKKFSQAKTQGHRQFTAEMETLGKVKHQNLVLLLGYCSFDEEKLLVYEYMVNGSLDLWLRNATGSHEVLDRAKRYKIACSSARGLAFLHQDFGLARLISACETHVSTDIAGTLGYIPPEYGQSRMSTTRGDVYSFGVILLELVTAKEPTGPEFQEKEGANLVGWVFQKMKKQQADDVLDPTVLNAGSKPMMLKMLRIAADCVADNPATRPTMLHVLKLLHEIVD